VNHNSRLGTKKITDTKMAESELVQMVESTLSILADDDTLADLRSMFLRDLNRLVDNTVLKLIDNHQPYVKDSSSKKCLVCYEGDEEKAVGFQPLSPLTVDDIRAAGYRTTPSELDQYIGAPEPDNEVERLSKLQSLNIQNCGEMGSDPVFRSVAEAFVKFTGVSSVLISLVETERQRFMFRHNFTTATHTPRSDSFCTWTLLSPHRNGQLLIVNDATTDRMFAKNPLVTGPPHIRFYIGVPIMYDGLLLGTLCGLDYAPRSSKCNGIDQLNIMQLRNLSALVSTELRKRFGRPPSWDFLHRYIATKVVVRDDNEREISCYVREGDKPDDKCEKEHVDGLSI